LIFNIIFPMMLKMRAIWAVAAAPDRSVCGAALQTV